MERAAGLWGRLLAIDQALTRLLTLPRERRVLHFFALGLAHSGDGPIWVGLAAAAWLLGDSRWKARAVVVFAGLVLAEIAVIIVKMLFRRQRPPGGSGMIYRKADPYSFPSGHAARATMLCIIAGQLGPLPAFIVILLWSPFMVLSRVGIGIHYVFDVLAGIFLGWVLTALLLQFAPSLTTRF
jgi:membrane-associated phospholipid phosphatase